MTHRCSPCSAWPLVLLSMLLAGCVVNPVTGQRNLGLISAQQEIALGQTHFAPMQQLEGGLYRADPLLQAYVSGVGQRVAGVSGVELPYEFVVLNNAVPNAWALPGGKIAINRGLLLALNNEAELAAVLGHEVAHAAARHGAQQMERGLLLQGALVLAAAGTSQQDYAPLVLGAGQLGIALLSQRYSRDAEREADHHGTRWLAAAGYDPMAAVSLQQTFLQLSEHRRSDWLSGLFASHPPSQERVDNNRLLAQQLGRRGELGEARFAQAMSHLRTRAVAYEDAQDARDALRAGDLAAALQFAERALLLEPADASLHGLRGEILLAQGVLLVAEQAYDRALELDAQYFALYLGRALTRQRLDRRDGARADYQRSLALLPTATAYLGLGQLAERDGDRQAALAYYRQAGESPSAVGQAALARVVTLDMPRNPGRYVQVEFVHGAVPQLWVTSLTDLDLRDVNVRVRLEWADGHVENLLPQVAHLGARQRVQLNMPARRAALVQARAFPLTGRPAAGAAEWDDWLPAQITP